MAAQQQDVFNRRPHQSQTTLSKHINTLLLTDKKPWHLSTANLHRPSERKTASFFFQMDGQVSYKSTQGGWVAFKDPQGQCRAIYHIENDKFRAAVIFFNTEKAIFSTHMSTLGDKTQRLWDTLQVTIACIKAFDPSYNNLNN